MPEDYICMMKDSCNKAWVRGVMTVVKPFLGMKTQGVENIDMASCPSVFICNHGVSIGPVAALIYLPVHFRPWIHDKMLVPEDAEATMTRTFENRYNFLGQRTKRRIIRRVSVYMADAMASFNPIPVSRIDPMRMLNTVQSSIQALEEGDNLLIFPENPAEHYDAESFRNLHPAFGILGYQYYQKTGKNLVFYPCFADKRGRRFAIGKPVVYTPTEDVQTGIRRVVSQVQAEMIELSN